MRVGVGEGADGPRRAEQGDRGALQRGQDGADGQDPGTNCIKMGLPGKLILTKRKGLQWRIFQW